MRREAAARTAPRLGRDGKGHDRALASADWIVAIDGMGGLEAPGLAADLAEITALTGLESGADPGEACWASHVALLERWPSGTAGAAMAVARLEPNAGELSALVAHIGDCRVYLLDETSRTCLTVDHTRLAEKLGRNPSGPEIINDRGAADKLYRSAGDPDLKPQDVEFTRVDLNHPWALVAATDGAWSHFETGQWDALVLESDLRTVLERFFAVAAGRGLADDAALAVVRSRSVSDG